MVNYKSFARLNVSAFGFIFTNGNQSAPKTNLFIRKLVSTRSKWRLRHNRPKWRLRHTRPLKNREIIIPLLHADHEE